MPDDISTSLILLHRLQDIYYYYYKSGHCSEEEYLRYMKTIDKHIDKLESATLLDNLVLKESF